ncbi:uncharacterized protein LOC112567728 isoform X2 [Pomacea canaliculata]|uniref:uncharacterized protein LOC112567728 isoform X2 n=1 Tax=Pomacea canaliculata TaxID=400727 RepID=UPI000D73C2F3|nr:uncharacterized protein LOC112567728 isoform X2 [Pomacea canaliculata]
MFESPHVTMSTYVGLIVLVFFRDAYVTSLELCPVWNYLELKEGRDDNTFTCTGLTDQQEVSWLINNIVLKKCPPVPPSCHDLAYGYFNISRTSNEYYDITVLATRISDLSIFSENVTCKTNTEAKLCQLDIIYPAENSTCHIEFSEETWTVTGWCSVPKLKSTRFLDKSGCYFHQTSQTAGTTAEVGFYKMNLKPSTQTGYYTGTCNMTSYLPSEGRYSYTVIIMPGQVNVSPTFTGSNEIRRPSGSLTHNCPQYVTEGADLTCQCSVSDLGSPQGRLQWNITGSSQLSLTGLKREQHGENYVCSLMWNKTVQQSLTYTLIVIYKPSKMIFKLNNIANSIVTVAENTTVTLLCQSDGRPAPSLTITDVTNGNRVLQSESAGNITQADQRQLSYNITAVQCEASGEYRCAANNGVGQMYQSLTLFVKWLGCLGVTTVSRAWFLPPWVREKYHFAIRCFSFAGKPRNNDPNYTSRNITEGKSASFDFIAYPTSVNVTKYYLGQDMNTEGPAMEGVFKVTCSVSSVYTYTVTCTVNVINVTADTSGYYKLVVSNELGNTSFIFAALPRNITESMQVTSGGFPPGAIAGLVAGLVVIIAVVAIVVVCFYRQKGGRKNRNIPVAKQQKNSDNQGKDIQLTANTIYESSDKQPLASEGRACPENHGAVLSMSPVTESAYQNSAFTEETTKKGKIKGKGAKEAKRRNDEGLLYTTVVFSNSPSAQPHPPPKSEPTEYATIRQTSAQ